ncbi:heterokaryon incompatibility protein-domain-containing protein [Podospora appendiculata]|uniref:Heterokaryon incompatibility protein-domain-containing protein n=1 Tax=Podospora appendiculata TaxID=314037 RepID=A0AAE0XDB6_9PEZI|nr:heterokaryon incompatibility protein-domain-containing protein [Podospora appendiculata]
MARLLLLSCTTALAAPVLYCMTSSHARETVSALYHHFLAIAFRFRYTERLSSEKIRLVRVHPASTPAQQRVQLTIETFPLDSCPRYIALSYTWQGAQLFAPPYTWRDSVPALLNNRVFLLQPNLHHALSQLSRSRPDSYVWIDAICINQDDRAEMVHQLDIMDLIYTMASETIVWLGQATERSTKALQTVDLLGVGATAKVLAWAESRTYGDAFYPGDLDLLERNGLPRFTEEDWLNLCDVYTRNWFGRVWMMQEVSMSRNAVTVLLGHHERAWITVAQAATVLCMSQVATGLLTTGNLYKIMLCKGVTVAFGLQIIREWCVGETEEWREVLKKTDFAFGMESASASQTLVSLLIASASFQSSLAIDKVVSLLGIVRHLMRTRGQPLVDIIPRGATARATSTPASTWMRREQQPSLEARSTRFFREVGISLFSETNSLNLLTLAGDGSRTPAPQPPNLSFYRTTLKPLLLRLLPIRQEPPTPPIPSWIPTYHPLQVSVIRPNHWGISSFNASRVHLPPDGREVASMIDAERGTLAVRCLDLGPVEEFGETCEQIIAGQLDDCCRLILRCGPTYAPTGQPVVEAFWRTLVLDQDMVTRPAPTSVGDSFSNLMKATATMTVYRALGDGLPITDVIRRFEPRFILAGIDTTAAMPSTGSVLTTIFDMAEVDDFSKRLAVVEAWEGAASVFKVLLRLAFAPARRPFRSMNGRLGLAAPGAQVGDRIVVVRGCAAPLMVRRVVARGEACYRLVGDAYVHGVMDGEVVGKVGEKDWATITLV